MVGSYGKTCVVLNLPVVGSYGKTLVDELCSMSLEDICRQRFGEDVRSANFRVDVREAEVAGSHEFASMKQFWMNMF